MLRWNPILHLPPQEPEPAATVERSSVISEGGGVTKYRFIES